MSIPQDFRKPIVAFGSLIGKDNDSATFRYFNRESSQGQEPHHAAKIEALRKAHASLGVSAPFVESHYTGSGSLKILYDFFNLHDLNLARLGGTYWKFLEDELRKGLDQTVFKKPLYAIFLTQSRLMRPPGLDVRKVATWGYHDDDYKIFDRWLAHCFGKRADDIVFPVLCLGTPDKDRSFEVTVGMQYNGNMGGRQQKFDFDSSKGRRQFRRMLEQEALEFRRLYGMNSGQILREFKQKWLGESTKFLVKVRMIELWLKKAGCPAKPGRQKKERIADIKCS